MVGSSKTSEPITGKIVFGGFGKNSNLENLMLRIQY